MLNLKRLKSTFGFSEKSKLNIAQSYEEKFGIKNKTASLYKPQNEKPRTIK